MRSSDTGRAPLWTRRAVLKGGAASLVAAVGLGSEPAAANALHVGAPAPPVSLVTLDGVEISTAELKGQVVLVTFWATWCVPCREELPLLSRFQDEHRAEGLQVLGIALDPPDELADVRRIASGLSFPNALQARVTAPGYGRIWRLPVSFVLDRAGTLVLDGWKERRPAWTPARLEEVLAPLLRS